MRERGVKNPIKIEPGDLMVIKHAGDQPPWTRSLVGKMCIVIKNLTQEDGVTSSPNIWKVMVDGVSVDVHLLDLEQVPSEAR